MAIKPLSPTCLTVVKPASRVMRECFAANIALVSLSVLAGLSAFDWYSWPKCTCISIRPGINVLPRRSKRVSPSSILINPLSIEVIMSLSIVIEKFFLTLLFITSINESV